MTTARMTTNLSITGSDALEQFFIYVCRHTAANLVILWSGLYAKQAELHTQTDISYISNTYSAHKFTVAHILRDNNGKTWQFASHHKMASHHYKDAYSIYYSCFVKQLLRVIWQVAQLSQRDRAAGWVSNGQKWKTGTERQYLRTI